jgi:hypothetical protein
MGDFFETGIYVLIVAVAMLLCLIIILVLSASNKPKRPKRKLRGLPEGRRKIAASDQKLLPEGGITDDDLKGKKSRKDKKSKPEKNKKDGKKPVPALMEKEGKDKNAGSGEAEKTVTAAATQDEKAEAPAESLTVAALPSLDTLDESGDDNQEENASQEDLMSIFQIEEEEDSYVSDLANKLFDVETRNLQALGLELLEVFSGGKSSRQTKEERDEHFESEN